MQPSWRHIFWIGFPLSLITAEIGRTGVHSWRSFFLLREGLPFLCFGRGTSLHRFLGSLGLVVGRLHHWVTAISLGGACAQAGYARTIYACWHDRLPGSILAPNAEGSLKSAEVPVALVKLVLNPSSTERCNNL
ncbi:hypothetical protein EDD18DRAFT_225258 [Armillaria luteobubalina]|uniref:Secreted protein n=1 Tax=Armillaria luteobubalina TaxID=153913 RepID=A0AA39Q471_9AGAR|nr:hypothetical protein EDD18DRAFT_225258 [Armillaria luteobubalina]